MTPIATNQQKRYLQPANIQWVSSAAHQKNCFHPPVRRGDVFVSITILTSRTCFGVKSFEPELLTSSSNLQCREGGWNQTNSQVLTRAWKQN
jgi:hypothetical protein